MNVSEFSSTPSGPEHMDHNCGKGPELSGGHAHGKTVWISVRDLRQGQAPLRIPCNAGQSIQQALREYGVAVNAVCAGRGTCGKCGVRVLQGEVPASAQDRRFYRQEELERGMRLSCKAYPQTDCDILLESAQEEKLSAVSDFMAEGQYGAKRQSRGAMQTTRPFGIAVDLGTTTLAMQLVNLEHGQVLDTYTAENRQRAYGADVISRILASSQGYGRQLRESIIRDLQTGMDSLCKRNGFVRPGEWVREICIAGNTTMLHLLQGYSCETLGAFPFTPVSIETVRTDWGRLMGNSGPEIPVTLLPGISAFVGADITAGMLACGMGRTGELTLLLDLGTNGEMTLGSCDRILGASTAAGPAFEGGNISCGVGSIPGAITQVEMEPGHIRCRTIEELPPVGICGTGVLETVYELLRAGGMDETGLLAEAYFDSGIELARRQNGERILFTQKDVRQFQLAKSAVRAGIETLLLRLGAEAGEVGRIYVAGGFGYEMDFDKALGIGLLPKAFEGRITAVGNSSLNGALQYLIREDALAEMERIIAKTTEVTLSNDPHFNEKYMEYMYFDPSLV